MAALLAFTMTLLILSKPVDVLVFMDVIILSISNSVTEMLRMRKLGFSRVCPELEIGVSFDRSMPLVEINLVNSFAMSR